MISAWPYNLLAKSAFVLLLRLLLEKFVFDTKHPVYEEVQAAVALKMHIESSHGLTKNTRSGNRTSETGFPK